MTNDGGVMIERLQSPSPEERDAVLALESASFSIPWSTESFTAMLGTPAGQLYVARRDDGRIVGFCACYLLGDEVHIIGIAVDPGVRRKGIGSAMIRDVLARTGARRATLEVRESNAAARAMYDRLGFKVTAVRQRYYDKPEENGLILWLDP